LWEMFKKRKGIRIYFNCEAYEKGLVSDEEMLTKCSFSELSREIKASGNENAQ